MGNGMTFYADARTFIAAQRAKAADARPGYRLERIVGEMNGVGSMPVETLRSRLGSVVEGVYTTARLKEEGLGVLRVLLAEGRLVLPHDEQLLRELRGLQVRATATGALSIAAASEGIHDDLADALTLACTAIPFSLAPGRTTDLPPDTECVTAPNGVRIPKVPSPRQAALADLRRLMATR
jgi:hypothetical protein